jgi:predicted RNase H-like HicB family nuclease
MKVKKAVKRLAKIKLLISDLTKQYSASAPDLREVLQYAEAAVTKAKEALGLHVSSRTKAGKAERAAKKARHVGRKAAVKKGAVKPRTATAKKRTPVKKAIKRTPARTAPAPAVQAAIS